MSPPPASTRQRTNERQKNGADEANGADVPSQEEIDAMIDALSESKTVSKAKAAIRALEEVQIMEKDVGQKIVKENIGIGAIIRALEKWYQHSSKFTYHAIRLLASITVLSIESAQKFIATSGGVETVLAAVKRRSYELLINKEALMILLDLSACDTVVRRVARDECIDMVIKGMKRWPKDSCIQENSCKYFLGILKIEEVKAVLHDKKLGSRFALAMDNFRGKNEVTFMWAK